MSKAASRWKAGNVRYDDKTQKLIGRKYREHRGWHQGARVRRR